MITFYFSQTNRKTFKGYFTPVFFSDKNAIILLWPPDEFQPWTNLSFQTTSRWKMSKIFLRTARRESNIMPGSRRLQTSREKSLRCHLRRPGTTLKFTISYISISKLKRQKLFLQENIGWWSVDTGLWPRWPHFCTGRRSGWSILKDLFILLPAAERHGQGIG